MTPSLRKALLGLHFPVFLILLVYVSLEFILIPADWAVAVSDLHINLLEIETVLFLSRFMFMLNIQNFLMIGVLVFLFTILSRNVKKFIISSFILYFFINFFFFYFSYKFSPSLMALYMLQFFLSILSTCILFLLWSVVPHLILKKIQDHKGKNQASSIGIGTESVTCKNCREKYLSNPMYCVKCLSKFDG